jgi:hypothetical protein
MPVRTRFLPCRLEAPRRGLNPAVIRTIVRIPTVEELYTAHIQLASLKVIQKSYLILFVFYTGRALVRSLHLTKVRLRTHYSRPLFRRLAPYGETSGWSWHELFTLEYRYRRHYRPAFAAKTVPLPNHAGDKKIGNAKRDSPVHQQQQIRRARRIIALVILFELQLDLE